MQIINYFDISYNTEIIDTIINHCIDTTRSETYNLRYKCEYTLIEKFIYDIAKFHANEIGLEDFYVQFHFKSKTNTNNIMKDCKEYINGIYEYPVLSCLTFFNDFDESIIVFTDINDDTYQYKKFSNQKNLYLTIPKKNKQIVFNPKFHSIHIDTNKDANNFTLLVNIWNRPSVSKDYIGVDMKGDSNLRIMKNEGSISSVCMNDDSHLLNYEFFENLLYNNEYNDVSKFKEYMNCELYSYFHFYIKSEKVIDFVNDIFFDIDMMNNNKIYSNRFLQRIHERGYISSSVCKWLLNEIYTYKKKINNDIINIPVSNIENIRSYINYLCHDELHKLIYTKYSLNKPILLNITDIYITQHDSNTECITTKYNNESFMNFHILLSDTCEFDGGEIFFEDGLSIIPNQGDLIIYSSKINHVMNNIKKGTQYLLSGSIKLIK